MALTDLEMKLVKDKRKRNAKVMEKYRFARKLGFKAEAATLVMRMSYENMIREAELNPHMLQPRTGKPPMIPERKTGGRPAQTTTATPKDGREGQGDLFQNVQPRTRHGGSFDKVQHDKYMGGND